MPGDEIWVWEGFWEDVVHFFLLSVLYVVLLLSCSLLTCFRSSFSLCGRIRTLCWTISVSFFRIPTLSWRQSFLREIR